MKNKAWLLGAGVALAAIALTFPIINLLQEKQGTVKAERWLANIPDPKTRAVAPILKTKCMDCHSQQTHFPFYADFPVARDIIRKDIEEALLSVDFTDVITGKKPMTDIEMARMEEVLKNDSMPPLKYVALHWNARLSPNDKRQLFAWVHDLRRNLNKTAGNAPGLINEPFRPLPSEDKILAGLNPEKIRLGERLFHDKRLSGDGTLSCASCHDLKKGGTDQTLVSTGIRGQKGPINSPTVYNAVYSIRQFWDGRAADLIEQAPGPVHNPLEMGSNWKQVLTKLATDAAYQRDFKRLYPKGMTGDTIADAIATFEKTLVTPNSRFDRYLKGDKLALNVQEKQGYTLFKTHCASCHVGPTLGSQSFEKMGKKADYFAWRGHLTDADNGQFNFTKRPGDKHKFKVPTLRNVEVTYPYFHDGTAKDLRSAVALMGQYQLGQDMSAEDVDAITAFLKTLTGEYRGQSLAARQ